MIKICLEKSFKNCLQNRFETPTFFRFKETKKQFKKNKTYELISLKILFNALFSKKRK